MYFLRFPSKKSCRIFRQARPTLKSEMRVGKKKRDRKLTLVSETHPFAPATPLFRKTFPARHGRLTQAARGEVLPDEPGLLSSKPLPPTGLVSPTLSHHIEVLVYTICCGACLPGLRVHKQRASLLRAKEHPLLAPVHTDRTGWPATHQHTHNKLLARSITLRNKARATRKGMACIS